MELLWIFQPSILWKKYDIYPDETNNKFNAIIRLLIICLIFFIAFQRYSWTYICVLLIIIITYIGYNYKIKQDEKQKYKLNIKKCRKSTINNPMANLMPYASDENFEACDENSSVIENNLYDHFYEMENDLGARNKFRSFLTLPSTQNPNNREKVLEFFYNTNQSNQTCKEDGVHCHKYRDVRYSR